jgi:hypothetical protein
MFQIFFTNYLFPNHGLNADEEKKMNATYIISIARKLGCSIFLLPEDITEVLLKSEPLVYFVHVLLETPSDYIIWN